MRKILTLLAMMALAGCGGGGGANTPNPNPQPPVQTTAPASGFVTPQFVIRIPARQGASNSRTPKYISSATLSVKITLTADSVGIDPTTITGNPAVTNVAAGSCTSGCTVNGPPTPPGTDSFTIVTYDANGATGHALNAAQKNGVTITAGANTAVSVILGAIPASLSISGVPTGAGALVAGTITQTASISVVAADGAGNTIPTAQAPNVFYVDATGALLNITVTDPDTNAHGSCVVNSGTSTCTGAAPTSVTFSGPDVTRVLAYDGLAENPVTLTATASGATNGTTSFQPKLNAPAFNSTPATPTGVALTSSAEIDLFAPTGIGSTGTEYFTESGWTGIPYNHALLVTGTPACTPAAPALTGIATVAAGTNDTTKGTPFTATAVASPTAGSCPVTVGDGLSSNTTDGSATLTVTYTTSTVTGSSKRRQ